jgi:hypothetical protein
MEYGNDGGLGADGKTRSLVQVRLGMQMLPPRPNKTPQTAPACEPGSTQSNSHGGLSGGRSAELDHPASVMPFAVACLETRIFAALPPSSPAALPTLTHASSSDPASVAVHKMAPLSGNAVQV